MVIETGEIMDYKMAENKLDSFESVKKSLYKMRQTINANFSGGVNEMMITRTYKENMTDTEKLYNDSKNFYKRLRTKYGQDIEYMQIIEPQGRGAFHCHDLVKRSSGEKLFIPQSELLDMWRSIVGQGGVFVKRIKNVDNIGAYLTAYLTDLEVPWTETLVESDDLKLVVNEDGNKAFLKGQRLKLYPSGMQIFRCSKGIVRPEPIDMVYYDVKKIVGDKAATFTQTTLIKDVDGCILNKISYEQYNYLR